MQQSIFLGNRIGYAASKHPYSLPTDLLARHCYVIGKTGTGKTTLLKRMVSSLILQGRGVGIIDPHGDFGEEILQLVPPERIDDVIYLDPTDDRFAPALNLVSSHAHPKDRPLIASALVAAFRHIWSDSWGPRMEYILYNALRALLDSENTSLASLPRFFSDTDFRQRVLRQCRDPFVRNFWQEEFEAWDRRFQLEAIAPIQNKLGQFTAMPALRHTLGQVRLRIDFRDILDSGKILVVNLSKGKLGDDASRLLGALLTAYLGSIAQSRADTPEEQRHDFTLFIDETQNFLSDALASILSESRKYGLSLVLSHQFLDQLTPTLQSAVLGNVGTIFAFTVSGDDAGRLARNFGGDFPPHQFTDLPPYTAMVRANNEHHFPFRLEVAPPDFHEFGYRDAIVKRSRQRYCSPRPDVEEKLRRFLQ